ncbi:MAG: threonine/serine dehydratase [Candidatus Krumholzibacteriota bacterium]|nr:threonine/serine dehydratase [Candidatus Krumholzibacteriota bacterium]
MLDVRKAVIDAESLIRAYIRETPLARSSYLSEAGGADVACKLENLQYSGSFKFRGALSRILSLSREDLSSGVVTASTGNHGAAVARALEITGGRGTVFVPEGASGDKLRLIRQYGAEIEEYGTDNAETEAFARKTALNASMTYISPYNDREVIAGQGTIGLELERQIDHIDAIFASVGGGGLISGIGGYIKSIRPDIRMVGCSPENSKVMAESLKAGKILDIPSMPTISDGTAGGIEPGAITFGLCREYIDDFITVTEEEIKNALAGFIRNEHMLIEGAAAVSVASYLKTKESYRGKNVVIVICGANIDAETLKEVLSDYKTE